MHYLYFETNGFLYHIREPIHGKYWNAKEMTCYIKFFVTVVSQFFIKVSMKSFYFYRKIGLPSFESFLKFSECITLQFLRKLANGNGNSCTRFLLIITDLRFPCSEEKLYKNKEAFRTLPNI